MQTAFGIFIYGIAYGFGLRLSTLRHAMANSREYHDHLNALAISRKAIDKCLLNWFAHINTSRPEPQYDDGTFGLNATDREICFKCDVLLIVFVLSVFLRKRDAPAANSVWKWRWNRNEKKIQQQPSIKKEIERRRGDGEGGRQNTRRNKNTHTHTHTLHKYQPYSGNKIENQRT